MLKTLGQLKKEYIEITTAIIDLGHEEVLIELNKSIKQVNWKVDKLSKDAVVELNKFDEEISKIKTSIFNTTNETINNMKEGLTSKIRNINNNMNVSMDELKDSVDIEISDQDDRLNSIDKKLEELEKYLDNNVSPEKFAYDVVQKVAGYDYLKHGKDKYELKS